MWYTMSPGCVQMRLAPKLFKAYMVWCAKRAKEKGREPQFVAFRDSENYVVVLAGSDGSNIEIFAEFSRDMRLGGINEKAQETGQ